MFMLPVLKTLLQLSIELQRKLGMKGPAGQKNQQLLNGCRGRIYQIIMPACCSQVTATQVDLYEVVSVKV